MLRDIEPEDLVRYGLIPEFVGRMPIVATLQELDEAQLIRILTEPKNALTRQYERMFEMENAAIEFREEGVARGGAPGDGSQDGRPRGPAIHT